MEKKQSSIEWLEDKLNGVDTGVSYHYFTSIIEQAKAMHKEEVESAWVIGCDNGYDKACDNITWDEMDNNKYNYYNETFGGEGERHK